MEIKELKLSEIHPYEKNPRINESAVYAVSESIKKFGFRQPIVVDGNGTIVAGHTRYKAAQQLGLETVPCVMADDLTPEQIKAYRIADNKTGELADWNTDLLGDELKELDALDINMTQFGFDELEIQLLTEDVEPERDEEEPDLDQYDGIGSKILKRQRVIITYDDKSKRALANLLGVDLKKVAYKAEDLLQ